MAAKAKKSARAKISFPSDITKLVAKFNQTCLRTKRTPGEPSGNAGESLIGCKDIAPCENPESLFEFRHPFILSPVNLRAPEPGESGSLFPVSSCLNISVGNIKVLSALDLIFEQAWFFQRVCRARLERTISVAPKETVRLSVSTSQRKFFSRNTLKETESSETVEASTSDRESVNINRSSTKTKNWQVSGNASVTIPIKGAQLGFGLGGSLSKSVSSTASSTVERVSDATEKSSKALRSLHKIDVTETTEFTTQTQNTRVINNPYNDRSMSIKVFGLSKEFRVDFGLTATRPSLIFQILRIDFTNDFVISHADFIDAHLIDERLKIELGDVLETVLSPKIESTIVKSEFIAKKALKYLFDVPNIFNVLDIPEGFVPTDANAPATSFDARLSKSGLNDAVAKKHVRVFTALNFFFKMYQDATPISGNQAISMCLSLDSALSPLWMSLEENNDFADVANQNNRTEVFRRLAGFLTYVSGALRPLLAPSEEERARQAALNRAEFVIDRVVDHLNCNREYYTTLYLEYTHDTTDGVTLREFVESLIKENQSSFGGLADFVDAYATEELFVSGTSIVVPGRCHYDEAVTNNFLDAVGSITGPALKFGVLDTADIATVCDGYHLEAISGECVLDEVPEQFHTPQVALAFPETPIPVAVTNDD